MVPMRRVDGSYSSVTSPLKKERHDSVSASPVEAGRVQHSLMFRLDKTSFNAKGASTHSNSHPPQKMRLIDPPFHPNISTIAVNDVIFNKILAANGLTSTPNSYLNILAFTTTGVNSHIRLT
ncbi:hypothetical protein J6590_032710 [Homalodisca vitripennis]|nr:hypothetical protein J6590_032710 [Homalodisca vitripennis]